MEYEQINYEVRGTTALVTLDRPERLNAFTVRMAWELMDAFDRSDADDAVRVVVLTGNGRAFCAGADLSTGGSSFDRGPGADQHDGSDPEMVGEGDQRVPADLGGRVVLRIHRSLKPVVAAINGPAVGVGLTMTLPMDVRLGVEGAKLGFVFNRRGISIDGAASWFLPRIVGIGRALEWIDTGRTFTAEEGVRAGLVSAVFGDASSLLSAAFDLADEMAENCAPVSMSVSRRLLWDAMGDSGPEDAHRRESVALYRRGRAGDVRAGVEAFLAKTTPKFVDVVSTSGEVLDPPR